jgi:hypothetical protein
VRRGSAAHLPRHSRPDRRGDRAGTLGEISLHVSDSVRAREYFEQCLAIAREIDHRELEGESELFLGEISLLAGDVTAARARFDRSLEVAQVAENKRGEALATWWIGKADIANGDAASAREKLGIALRAFQAVEMNAELLACIEDHAGLLCTLGTTQECVRIYAAVAAGARTAHAAAPPAQRAGMGRQHHRGAQHPGR